MKRSVDSYLSVTINEPYVGQGSSCIEQLPLEVSLQIFSHLSETLLRQLSSVSKTIYKLTSDDTLWTPIAQNILLSEELKSKLPNTSYKDYCLNMLIPIQMHATPSIILQPRNPEFVDKIKQLQLPNFKLLTPLELATVFEETNLSDLITEVNKSDPIGIRNAAEQKHGQKKYHFINCTDEVITINSKGYLCINNQDMLCWMGGSNYVQFFIYTLEDILYIYYTKEDYLMPIYIHKCIPDQKAGPGHFQIMEEEEERVDSSDGEEVSSSVGNDE
jgi:hypothetical protein